MNGRTATLMGAAAALAASPALATPAQPSPVPVAASYAELLEPVPNAIGLLKLAQAQEDVAPPQLIQAQYHHHHHHHHHRAWYLRHGYVWLNGAWVLRPRHHHHHHHNHY